MNKIKLLIGVLAVVVSGFVFYLIIKNKPKKNSITKPINPIDTISFKDDGKIHIVIDAGHGGPDVGAINTKLHLYEKNITRQVVDAVMAMVDTSKYAVLQTRPLDSNIHRHNRVLLATKFRTDLLLSFHCNAFVNKNWNGTEIHISDSSLNIKDSTSKPNLHNAVNTGLADTLSKNIATAFPDLKRCGVVHRKDRIWIIYAGNFPSIIIEWGYITNKNDIKIMQEPVAQQVLASVVWKSIDAHFGFAK